MSIQLNCILLIDDDEPTNFLNKLTLEQAGCTRQIKVAQSGQEALDYLRAAIPRPDLIFLDINMPVMDGWGFMESFVKIKPQLGKKITIYMVSSSINDDDIERAKSISDITDYVIKPISADALVELFRLAA